MSSTLIFGNNAVGTLAVAAGPSATTIQLTTGQGALFPQPAANQAFYVTVQTGTLFETMLCTNITADVLTVTRAQEGTVAQSFPIGSIAETRITAATLTAFLQVAPAETILAKINGDATQTFAAATATTDTQVTPRAQVNSLIAAALATGAGAQPGDIKYSASNTNPAGWLQADGSAVSRTTYAALYAAIGTVFGTGDGSSTFNLPDGRGVFLRGFDNGRGLDSGRTFGSYQADKFGSHNHGATVSIYDPGHNHGVNDPGHSHSVNAGSNDLLSYVGSGGNTSASGGNQETGVSVSINAATTGIYLSASGTGISASASISAAGSNETAPKNIALLCLIKT